MFESASVLDGLNDEQRAAAAHPDGPLLVLAGAGTGKTRTLVARAAWLCEQGVPPSRILLLTFTRRALFIVQPIQHTRRLEHKDECNQWGVRSRAATLARPVPAGPGRPDRAS